VTQFLYLYAHKWLWRMGLFFYFWAVRFD